MYEKLYIIYIGILSLGFGAYLEDIPVILTQQITPIYLAYPLVMKIISAFIMQKILQ